ncbi:MAG TPA: stage III sporulation protein AC [Thermaerobacter sp.]
MVDPSLILRLAGIGIIVTVVYTLLKTAGREEYAFTVLLAGLAVVLWMTVQVIVELFETIQSLFDLG